MPAPILAAAGRAALVAGRAAARSMLRRAATNRGAVPPEIAVSIRKYGDGLKNLERAVTAVGTSIGDLTVFLPAGTHAQPGHKPQPIEVVFAANEYGVVGTDGWHTPPRPALGEAVARNGGTWLRSAVQRLAMAVRGRTRLTATIQRLGRKILDDINRSYASWTHPANAPSTVRKKGFNDPLEETGMLRKAFRYIWSGRPSIPKGTVAAIRRLDRVGK